MNDSNPEMPKKQGNIWIKIKELKNNEMLHIKYLISRIS
jgi:hypothetical protein